MELWNFGMLELWNYGILELWNYELLYMEYGIMEYYLYRNMESLLLLFYRFSFNLQINLTVLVKITHIPKLLATIVILAVHCLMNILYKDDLYDQHDDFYQNEK